MSDAHLGIVRLDLPDGRTVPLQLTYAALDLKGHAWVIERLKTMAGGKAGSSTAVADLVELMSDNSLRASAIMAAPVGHFPLNTTMSALWAAWELAQYGPKGRPAEEGAANPPNRRPTLWARLFGRHSA